MLTYDNLANPELSQGNPSSKLTLYKVYSNQLRDWNPANKKICNILFHSIAFNFQKFRPSLLSGIQPY